MSCGSITKARFSLLSVAIVVLMAFTATAKAGNYEVQLFDEGNTTTIIGLGNIDVPNSDISGPPQRGDFTLNSHSNIGKTQFSYPDSTASLTVKVRHADPNGDGDTKDGVNKQTGDYVHGLSGKLDHEGYTVTFEFDDSKNPDNPDSYEKKYTIKDKDGKKVKSGKYEICKVKHVPEPDTLAMLCGGLLVMGWARRFRTR